MEPYLLGVLAGSDPDPDGLVVRTAGEQRPVQRHAHHPHPVPAHQHNCEEYLNIHRTLVFCSSKGKDSNAFQCIRIPTF